MAAYEWEVQIVGNALNSFGFTGHNTISGLGLNTFGFLWSSADIWTEIEDPDLVTTWQECQICENDFA